MYLYCFVIMIYKILLPYDWFKSLYEKYFNEKKYIYLKNKTKQCSSII